MTVPLKARVLLADDHAMVRRGLRLILDAEPDLEVVAEAGDGAEAVELALARTSTWPCSTSRCRDSPACRRPESSTSAARTCAC